MERSRGPTATPATRAVVIAIYPNVVWIAVRSLRPVPGRTVRDRSARNGHGRTRSAHRLSQGFRQPGP